VNVTEWSRKRRADRLPCGPAVAQNRWSRSDLIR
jgi:hypothetical protein